MVAKKKVRKTIFHFHQKPQFQLWYLLHFHARTAAAISFHVKTAFSSISLHQHCSFFYIFHQKQQLVLNLVLKLQLKLKLSTISLKTAPPSTMLKLQLSLQYLMLKLRSSPYNIFMSKLQLSLQYLYVKTAAFFTLSLC